MFQKECISARLCLLSCSADLPKAAGLRNTAGLSKFGDEESPCCCKLRGDRNCGLSVPLEFTVC